MPSVLITGATSGIGQAAATLFARHGYRLILTGRRKDRLSRLAASLGKKTPVKTLTFDIRNYKAAAKAVTSIGSSTEIDILVNNAGLALGLDLIHEGRLSDWETMIDTNLKGLLYMTRLVAPRMVQRGGGHIINIGSIAGKEVYTKGNVYSATKHAVDALTKGMRIDLLGTGVRVTAIHPGHVETEFALVRFGGDNSRAKAVYKGFNPLSPEDVAEAIFWASTRPLNVNINEMTIMPAAQANTASIFRRGQ